MSQLFEVKTRNSRPSSNRMNGRCWERRVVPSNRSHIVGTFGEAVGVPFALGGQLSRDVILPTLER
jgi:hypothetical protein